jgi:glutamyl-tRNA synthetase
LPLLLKPDGNGKLSKRDGDRLGFPVFPTDWKSEDGEIYTGYREQGYFPEAFINMLAFLGWNPGTTQELFSLSELVESFSLNRVAKAGAKFDPDKTKWFQQQYLRATDDAVLAEKLSPLLDNKYNLDQLTVVCQLMKERATFVKDIYSEGSFLLEPPTEFDETTVNKKWKDNAEQLMVDWQDRLGLISSFSAENIETEFKAFLEERGLGIGAVLPLFRLLVTGKGMGPSMFDISAFLGKEECLKRISAGINTLQTA